MSAKILLIFVAILQCSRAQREGYCLSSDYEPYLQFATKTAYEFVKGKEGSLNLAIGCEPIHFWSLNRHGTRLPGVTSIEELPKLTKIRDDIIENYEIRKTAPDRGRLCDQDIENLKNWVWNRNYTIAYASDLTYQGYDDLKYLAKRWQSRFSTLMPFQYNPTHYMFKYTDKRRTKDSYRAFTDGLFGREAQSYIHPEQAEANDTLLQLHDFCTAWINEVKDNPKTQEQINYFKNKEEYKNMVQNVSSHLGYRYALDEKVIKNIYDMCRYDKSWEINKNSPWCAAFTKDQLRLLEYVEDLKYYYENGYGNPLNKKLGCSPMKDMMDRFTKMIERPEETQPKVVAYFTNSKTLQSLVTALGIQEDTVPLLADNYHTPNIQRRMWKTSFIDPFASNLVAVLHRCTRGEKFQVMFYLNEKPVDFRDCQVGLCSWELLKRKYGDAVRECNPRNYCFKNTADLSKASYSTILLGSILSIFVAKNFL